MIPGPRTFRALASPTRVAILRTLRQRAHTGSELTRVLGLSDTAVRKHLKLLDEAGLVQRRDEGRPWTYHELSPDAHDLLQGVTSGAPLAVLGGFLAVLAWGLWGLAHRPDAGLGVAPYGTAPPSPVVDAWLADTAVGIGTVGFLFLAAFVAWRWMLHRLAA